MVEILSFVLHHDEEAVLCAVELALETVVVFKEHVQAVADLAAPQGSAFKQAKRILSDLIKAEVAEREVRSIQYQLKSARFPAYRDLVGFKFEESAVDVALVKSLHGCDFIESPTTSCSSAAPAPARRTWQQPSACRRSASPLACAVLLAHRARQPARDREGRR